MVFLKDLLRSRWRWCHTTPPMWTVNGGNTAQVNGAPKSSAVPTQNHHTRYGRSTCSQLGEVVCVTIPTSLVDGVNTLDTVDKLMVGSAEYTALLISITHLGTIQTIDISDHRRRQSPTTW